MIGGVALFDYNNDELLDIYLLNGAKIPGLDKSDPTFFNRLYKNNGNGTFSDVTEAAKVQGAAYAMGVAVGDFDNDGWMDLYIAGVKRNQLFRNNGDGSFTDVTAKSRVTGIHPKLGPLWAITAGWFDYNNDGWLDLFISNYLTWSFEKNPPCRLKGLRAYCHPDMFQGTPNMLYQNNGDGTFTDVSEASGIGRHVGKGMGIAFADYDSDGWVDVFVSNDTFRNFLFHNRGDGTFTEDAILKGVAYTESGSTVAGMGAEFKDFDHDGRPDIFQTAMFGNTFPVYRNGGAQFVDHTSAAGLSILTRRLTAYGLSLADFDNDGDRDLFTANGAILDNSMEVDNLPFKIPNSLFINLGNGRFADGSQGAGPGFLVPKAHRGAAAGDLDNDGRLDLVIAALNDPTEVLINRTLTTNHWLVLKLVGRKSNRDGIGARIKMTPATGAIQYHQVFTAAGYGSSADKRVHFGLGSAKSVRLLEVWWPSGTFQTIRDVPVDRILTVAEAE